jgi:hypothetical protein
MCRWPLPAQSFSGPSPFGLEPVFYCLRFETSLFVASYDSQGHGGGIRPRLHTGMVHTLVDLPSGQEHRELSCLLKITSVSLPAVTFLFASLIESPQAVVLMICMCGNQILLQKHTNIILKMQVVFSWKTLEAIYQTASRVHFKKFSKA